MSVLDVASGDAAPAPPAPLVSAQELPPPARRGRTEIAERVVAKIASTAAAEVDLATGAVRSVLGVRLGTLSLDSRPRVDVVVHGGVASVAVQLSVRYPAPVRAVTRQVRGRVAARVHELTGLEVAAVDIDVQALLSADQSQPRVR